MKKNDDRFICVYKQRHFNYIEIFVDKETGVNYLMVRSGYGAGLTPLIDADGKPIVTK